MIQYRLRPCYAEGNVRLMRWLALLVLLAGLSSGQVNVTSGSLSGRVTDGSGASIPGAGVAAMNLWTRTLNRGFTNGEGQFAFPVLASGEYELTVEARGFRTARVSP